jgi:hypothetical protein
MIMFCGLPVIVAVLPMFGGHRDGKQVGDRVALEPRDNVEDERCHNEADRVVDEKSRE